jgi:tetratricopeptide (TPR) repeat protein
VWEPGSAGAERKEAVRASFARSGKSYAGQAFAAASRLLDEYAGRWVATYTEACEATHVRGEQSAEVLDLRMACLRERLGNVRALTELYMSGDGSVVDNAATAAGALPSIDRCNDVALLRAVIKPPEDPARRRRVEALRDELARLTALGDAGQCRAAEPKAEQLIGAVRETGYKPLLAESLLAAAALVNNCGDPVRAGERFRQAYWAALEARADRVAAEAAGRVVAGEWLITGRAMLARIGGNPLLESWLDVNEGLLLAAAGDYEHAVEAQRRALAIKQRTLGPEHPDTLVSLVNVGDILRDARHPREALEMDQRARSLCERIFGGHHPLCGKISNNEGEALSTLGRNAEAVEAFQRAVSVMRAAGSDPFVLSYPLTGLGVALLGLERSDDAAPPLEEAYRIRKEHGGEGEQLAEVEFALARALWHRAADRERARGLALAARGAYAGTTKHEGAVAEVEAWLAVRSNSSGG